MFCKNENLKTPKDLTRNPSVYALLEEVEEADLKKREIEFLNSAKSGDIDKMKKLLEGENPVNINCYDDQGNISLIQLKI